MRTDYGLTEEKVQCAPGLARALSNFDAFLPSTAANGVAASAAATALPEHDVTLVTDGPLQGRN